MLALYVLLEPIGPLFVQPWQIQYVLLVQQDLSAPQQMQLLVLPVARVQLEPMHQQLAQQQQIGRALLA